jgi:hypothetical protein
MRNGVGSVGTGAGAALASGGAADGGCAGATIAAGAGDDPASRFVSISAAPRSGERWNATYKPARTSTVAPSDMIAAVLRCTKPSPLGFSQSIIAADASFIAPPEIVS